MSRSYRNVTYGEKRRSPGDLGKMTTTFDYVLPNLDPHVSMCDSITITAFDWSDLTARSAVSSIRDEVFIREQHVPEELEWDGLDDGAYHLLARDSFGNPVATARMLPNGHIGRVAVVKSWRGQGVATELMRTLLREARGRGLAEVDLDAQVKAVEFYLRLGFVAEGPEFMDAGIPHRHMRLRL